MLWCVSFPGDPVGYASVLGLVSFDFHPRSPFFSHRRHTLLLLISVFSFQHHWLSLCRRPLPFWQKHLLCLLRRSLTRSLCSYVPACLYRTAPLAAHALRIALNFSPQKAGTATARPAACAMVKGATGRRPQCHPNQTPLCPPRCRRDRATTSDPPHPRSPRGKTSSR
jgi:hypothetical protein